MIKFDHRYFYSSEYRTARIAHACAECQAPISSGQLYLYFVPREREHADVCLGCSIKKHNDHSLHWPCEAVRERIKELGDKAGLQLQGELL